MVAACEVAATPGGWTFAGGGEKGEGTGLAALQFGLNGAATNWIQERKLKAAAKAQSSK